MGKYKIKYDYQTGDSFGSEDTDGILDLEWNNLDVAKANLKRIQEHWEMYEKWTYGYGTSYQENRENLILWNKDKDWFVNDSKLYAWDKEHKNQRWRIDEEKKQSFIDKGYEVGYFPDETLAQNCIILYTDDGKPYQFWPSWCGYFERLHGAEIIENESDMKFRV